MKRTQAKNKRSTSRRPKAKESKKVVAFAEVADNAETTEIVIGEKNDKSAMLQPDFCFLKTKKQTLKQFEIRLDGDTLNFLR